MPSALNLARPRKVTVVEAIVEQVVQRIQEGHLKAGDKLPSERELIAMLQVSRSSVREALQALAMMGLVESRAGQGTFVTRTRDRRLPDMNDPALPTTLQREMRLSLIEARRTIECCIAEQAARRVIPAALARLQAAFAEYERHTLKRSDSDAAHHDFHMALAEMTGNLFYSLVVDTLLRAVPQSLRDREFLSGTDDDRQRILTTELELHSAILVAIEQHDPVAAHRAMAEHMDVEEQFVLQAYQDA